MDDIEHINTTEDVAETSIKKRPRKKHIYSQILQQMEFYFSNANLRHDRFLAQLLKKNKYVPLDVFLRFNKIKALTGSTEEIAKALGSSQLLKLTDDGKCVYRSSAIQKKENQEECIIYVEQLPPDANHDWVIGIFSAYGKVEYVSIPKYKNKATIKGFAFVEFDTPEAAKKALEAFGSAGCCLPPQMNPGELCSIATFEAGDSEEYNENNKDETDMSEKQIEKLKKKKIKSEDVERREFDFEHEKELAESEEPKSKKLKIDEHQEGEISKKKRKKKDMLDTEDNQQELLENSALESEATESGKTKKSKKRKLESENAENLPETKYSGREATSDDVSNKKKKKKNLEEAIDEGKEEIIESEVSTVVKNKKKKKHHQIENDTEEVKRNPEEMEDEFEDGNDLQQTKKSKKKKRCEVENDADKEVEDADDEGTSERSQKQTEDEVDDEEENNDGDEAGALLEKSDKKKRARKRTKSKKKNLDKKENDPASLGLRIISKEEWRRLRNKYLNLQREKMQGLKKHLARVKFGSSYPSPYPPYHAKEKGHQVVKEDPGERKTKYMPGVIIHMELAEPLGDVNGFKTEAKSHPGVAYVDASEGSSEVHIRCDSAEVAQKLIGTKPWDSMQILKGEAEKKYWEKVWTDREYKKNNKVRVNVRGRDKLLKRAERELGKHIKFDD